MRLNFMTLLSQPPLILELQVCTTVLSLSQVLKVLPCEGYYLDFILSHDLNKLYN